MQKLKLTHAKFLLWSQKRWQCEPAFKATTESNFVFSFDDLGLLRRSMEPRSPRRKIVPVKTGSIAQQYQASMVGINSFYISCYFCVWTVPQKDSEYYTIYSMYLDIACGRRLLWSFTGLDYFLGHQHQRTNLIGNVVSWWKRLLWKISQRKLPGHTELSLFVLDSFITPKLLFLEIP